MPLSSDLTGHPAQPQQPIRHYAMSDYLPSLKWPSALTFQTRATSPTEDAPLTALPECERTSLTQLTVQFTSALTAASLPSSDPWSSLNASQNSVLRDEILLRFLRFNSLQIDRTAKQLRSVLAWRAKSKISEQPVTVIRGMAAGIPVCIMDAVGRVGQRLFFASAEKYVKQDVDRRIQEIAVAKMFEHMLYDVDGPQVTGVDVVVDFMGFSTKNIDIFGLKTGVSTYLNYYPDIFHRIFLINYPKFLYGVWRIIRPLLDERTATRVIWLSDGAELRAELESAFSKADIPQWLGGGRDDCEALELLNGQLVDLEVLTDRFL